MVPGCKAGKDVPGVGEGLVAPLASMVPGCKAGKDVTDAIERARAAYALQWCPAVRPGRMSGDVFDGVDMSGRFNGARL